MIEIEQLAALFHIHKEASQHGSNFVNIKDAAWRELQKLDAQHKVEKPSTFVPTELDKQVEGTAADEAPQNEETIIERRDI
jgi:hypothetical protein